MTWQTRASLRATGQLGMLAAAVNMTVSTADLFVRQVSYTGVWALGWSQLRFYLYMAVSIALALIALQASSRTDSEPRHRRAALLSSTLAVALAVAAIATPLPGARSAMSLLISLISDLVWPLGAAACLALSYRGQPLGLGGPGALRPRSPWLWKFALPLAGIDLLAVALEERTSRRGAWAGSSTSASRPRPDTGGQRARAALADGCPPAPSARSSTIPAPPLDAGIPAGAPAPERSTAAHPSARFPLAPHGSRPAHGSHRPRRLMRCGPPNENYL